MNFAILTGFSDYPYPAPKQFSASSEPKDLLAAVMLYEHYLGLANAEFIRRIEAAKIFNPALSSQQQAELRSLREMVPSLEQKIRDLENYAEHLERRLAYSKKVSLGRLRKLKTEKLIRDLEDKQRCQGLAS